MSAYKDHDRIQSALLDSGASVSILGKNSIEFLESSGLKWNRIRSYVKTADGTPNEVLGYVTIPLTYNNIQEFIRLCVVPSLSEELYLGMDFWEKFGVIPYIISELKSVDEQLLYDGMDNKHALTEDETKEVDKVIALFPSFET